MPFLTKEKTNWKYILVVVILSALVGGGILGYLRYFKREISSFTKFPEIKKPEKPKIEEETANWKTYRNDEYGFEIKYPPDSKPREFYNSILFNNPPEIGGEVEIIVYKDAAPALTLESLISETRERGIMACVGGECYEPIFQKEVEIKLNEFIATQFQSVLKQPPSFSEATYYLWVIKTYIGRNNDVFIIKFSRDYSTLPEIPSEYLNYFNQMLSTFRFLE
jgi:hypothetical protein